MTQYTLPNGAVIDLSTPAGIQSGHDYLVALLASTSDPNAYATINGLVSAYDSVPIGNYPDPAGAYVSILNVSASSPPASSPGPFGMEMSTIGLLVVGIYLAWRMFQ